MKSETFVHKYLSEFQKSENKPGVQLSSQPAALKRTVSLKS